MLISKHLTHRAMKKVYLLLFITAILISCDKKQETITPNIIGYPMTVGSQWTYDRQIVVNKYESKTSKKIVSTETYNFDVKVWVEKDTILNGKQVLKFVAESGGLKHVNFHLMDQEGLKTYAYINPGLIVFARAESKMRIKSAALDKLLAQDPLAFEDTPVLDLKLPLQMGAKWTYRPSEDFSPLKIEKQVSAAETLTLAGERFGCYKIDWIYSNDSTFNRFQMNDWVSDKGLVKRTQTFDDIIIQNENREEKAYGQSSETLILKSVDIK